MALDSNLEKAVNVEVWFCTASFFEKKLPEGKEMPAALVLGSRHRK